MLNYPGDNSLAHIVYLIFARHSVPKDPPPHFPLLICLTIPEHLRPPQHPPHRHTNSVPLSSFKWKLYNYNPCKTPPRRRGKTEAFYFLFLFVSNTHFSVMQLPTLSSFAPPGRKAARGVCVFGSRVAKIMAAIKLFCLREAAHWGAVRQSCRRNLLCRADIHLFMECRLGGGGVFRLGLLAQLPHYLS